MTAEIFGYCILIIAARVVDVSLGTIRTICVVNGRRRVAWILGFFEILIWIFAVSKVIQNLEHPAFAIAYAIGFAFGNYVGITIEKRLAFGEQVVRVFTRKGLELAEYLRGLGFRVTKFAGEGRDGPVDLLFIEIPRRIASQAAAMARRIDPECFIVVDDVRFVSASVTSGFQTTDWRAIAKKK